MDALREQYEGGFKMSAYKDKTQGTWYVSFRYIDWTGKKTQKLKRGFKTKKEAVTNEHETRKFHPYQGRAGAQPQKHRGRNPA